MIRLTLSWQRKKGYAYTSSFLLVNFLTVICFCFILSRAVSLPLKKKNSSLKLTYLDIIYTFLFWKVDIKIRANESFGRQSALCSQ